MTTKNKRIFGLFILILCITVFFGCKNKSDTPEADQDLNEKLKTENIEKTYDFKAEYVRTDFYQDEVEYPIAKIIRSVEELDGYYKENKNSYFSDSENSSKFLNVCDKYDSSYFEDNILILVVLEETSGSVSHEVESIKFDGSELSVNINCISPESGTCDMAEWHIFIEPDEKIAVTDENITVTCSRVAGIDLPDEKKINYSTEHLNMSFELPSNWEYELILYTDTDEECFAYEIWPKTETEGKISISADNNQFAVCGTALTSKDIVLGKYTAWQGTYDMYKEEKMWSFISIRNVPGSYVILNEGADAWWDEYENEAMKILSSLVVADGFYTGEEALEAAKKYFTFDYYDTDTVYDYDHNIWKITFFKNDSSEYNPTFWIDLQGNVSVPKF